MFGRFKFAAQMWSANRAASRINALISPALFTVAVPGGGFDLSLTSDVFVVGYIYGVIAAWTAYEDAGEKQQQNGLILQRSLNNYSRTTVGNSPTIAQRKHCRRTPFSKMQCALVSAKC